MEWRIHQMFMEYNLSTLISYLNTVRGSAWVLHQFQHTDPENGADLHQLRR